MRALLPFVVAGVLCAAGPRPSATTQAVNARPERAVVFIRLLGQIELDPSPSAALTQALRDGDVELGTGSGFLFSAYGHVLTCAHVLRAEPFRVLEAGMPIEVKPTVRRIEVLLPAAEGEATPAPFEATILATDNDLDLAVLTISSSGMPYLHLGDSEAVEGGDAVEALGFPFGRRLEIARPAARAAGAPAVSITRGNVSASRLDAQGERRYLQTTAALNAGNSGGPILDADGYAVGIANSIFTVRNAPTGVGFAVPVDLAKRFLQANSLDTLLEARPISLGPLSELEGKGIRLTLPYGLADRSPVRSRVDTGGESDPILLRVDRVLSPWGATRLAETLTNGEAFEAFSATGAPTQKTGESRGRSLLLGRVAGTLRGWGAVRMGYRDSRLGAGEDRCAVHRRASPGGLRCVGPPRVAQEPGGAVAAAGIRAGGGRSAGVDRACRVSPEPARSRGGRRRLGRGARCALPVRRCTRRDGCRLPVAAQQLRFCAPRRLGEGSGRWRRGHVGLRGQWRIRCLRAAG